MVSYLRDEHIKSLWKWNDFIMKCLSYKVDFKLMKKILHLTIALIFIVGFGLYFGPEYWQFRDAQKLESSNAEVTSQSIKDFSINSVPDFRWKLELYSTPNKEFLTQIVSEIDAAQNNIYVEVYIFTEKDMRDAIIRAHNRWVEVKILLENNPYQAPYLNDKHYNSFVDAGIDVRWSDPLNYSLNHAKLLMIDEFAYISTWNFSYSLFTKNRDLLVKIGDVWFVQKLRELFLLDYERIAGWVIDSRLVLSPSQSRFKLVSLIESAATNLDIYFPYLADDALEELIIKKSKEWVQVRLVVEKLYFNENPEVILKLTNAWIMVQAMKWPKLHAKSILSDWKLLYIWSINFSRYSLDENREIWILLQNKEIIEKFTHIFSSDFDS